MTLVGQILLHYIVVVKRLTRLQGLSQFVTKKSSQWSCQCSSRSQYYLYKGHITFKLWTLSLRHYLTSQFWGWWLWYVECSSNTVHWPSCVCTVWVHHMNNSIRTVAPCMILKKKHSLPISTTLKSLINLTLIILTYSQVTQMCTQTHFQPIHTNTTSDLLQT